MHGCRRLHTVSMIRFHLRDMEGAVSIRNTADVRQLRGSAAVIEPDLTLDDIAAELKVSRSMAYKLVNSGEIDSYRVGRFLRVTRAALDRFKHGEEEA